jgi:hypothetical protein
LHTEIKAPPSSAGALILKLSLVADPLSNGKSLPSPLLEI